MRTTFADRLVQPDERAIDPLRLAGSSVTSAAGAVARDRQFLSLLQSFRPSGGVSRAQGVTDLLFTGAPPGVQVNGVGSVVSSAGTVKLSLMVDGSDDSSVALRLRR